MLDFWFGVFCRPYLWFLVSAFGRVVLPDCCLLRFWVVDYGGFGVGFWFLVRCGRGFVVIGFGLVISMFSLGVW